MKIFGVTIGKKEVRTETLAELDAKMDAQLNAGGSMIPGSKYAAINLAAVFCGATIRTQYFAMVPLKVYRERPDGGKDVVKTHPAYKLLHDKPNPLMTSYSWRQTMELHAIFYGGGFSKIVRDAISRPAALYLLDGSRMKPLLRSNGTELWWSYTRKDGTATEYPDSDIVHLPGLAFDGIQGEGIIKNAARSLYLSDSVEEFGADFFKNGIHPGGTLNTEQTMSPEAKDQLKKSLGEWSKRENWHRTLVLDWGLKWNKISFSPEEAQFLGSREFQDIEIARWLNLPRRALKLADADGLRNVEQINIELVQGTMMPRYIAFEQELKAKLFSDDDSYFAEFVVDGLLRGDAKSRAEVHKIYREIGVESANEIRMMENKNPREDEGGDEYWSQPNLAANKTNGEKQPEEKPNEEEAPAAEGEDDVEAQSR